MTPPVDRNIAPSLQSSTSTADTSWWNQWSSDISTVSSILGLLLSLYVSYSIYEIRKRYARKARIPEINEKLRLLASEISIHIDIQNKNGRDFDINSTTKIIQAFRPHINDAIELTSGNARKHGKQVKKHIENHLSDPNASSSKNERALWQCYRDISEMADYLESATKNDSWS